MEQKKVAVFDLSNMTDKRAYELIINTYPVIKEEFAYLARSGDPKVTVWYVDTDA